MRVQPIGVELVLGATDRDTRDRQSRQLSAGTTELDFGPISVALGSGARPGTDGWSIANSGTEDVSVRSVSIVYEVAGTRPPISMLRHGYQSWSRTDLAILGQDSDPSLSAGSIELIRAAAHADQSVAPKGELRSEWVTVLSDASGDKQANRKLLFGFDGGSRHDGTFRLSALPAGSGTYDRAELRCEAFLGGAVLHPGDKRQLHRLIILSGTDQGVIEGGASASELLERWATEVGRSERARRNSPYIAGWCSWYHYYHGVTERDIRSNLAIATDDSWPFDVFQVDDGYQAGIGDWLETSERFSGGLKRLAADITATGCRAGLWLAPFLVAPDSPVAREHPDWLARQPSGDPLPGCFNPPWGGGLGGLVWTLDTTHPDVAEHLERTAATVIAMGFSYLKLDFTYAPSFDGIWLDRSKSPAERVRAGYDAIRRGAGEAAWLLGCGAPLSNVVGVVDGMRIGPDVAPAWQRERDDAVMAGYHSMLPSTRQAAAAVFARSFMHRKLWLNDPDCVMLRGRATSMRPEQIETWARVVESSGGMAIVSDDLALLGQLEHRRLEALLERCRAVDEAAAGGAPPRCPDLMTEIEQPSSLETGGERLVIDAATGQSSYQLSAGGTGVRPVFEAGPIWQ